MFEHIVLHFIIISNQFNTIQGNLITGAIRFSKNKINNK